MSSELSTALDPNACVAWVATHLKEYLTQLKNNRASATEMIGVAHSQPLLRQNQELSIEGSGFATKERPMYIDLPLDDMPDSLSGA
jgi:hypothetical protein